MDLSIPQQNSDEHPTTPTYNQASINAIEAVFGLLSDHGGIVGGAERRVYLAI